MYGSSLHPPSSFPLQDSGNSRAQQNSGSNELQHDKKRNSNNAVRTLPPFVHAVGSAILLKRRCFSSSVSEVASAILGV
jgi:hypothetical protein